MVIPCGHHVQELVPKHLTRLLSGRPTTGPGEILFLKFYNAQNDISSLIRPDTVLKRFDYDMYDGTRVRQLADFTKGWAENELRAGSFSRGDYRWFERFFFYKILIHQIHTSTGVCLPGK